MGAAVLKRFNITWDYPHQQIFFEPNRNYLLPDVFDRAGLWANLAPQGFLVVDVIHDGPADQGGLKAGDVIKAVDGKAAGSELSLPDFRLYLKRAPATPVKLDLARGAESLQITLTLRDLI